MRYADGGGLTAEERARRTRVRLQAAQMFEQDMDPGADRPAAAGQHEIGVHVAAGLARGRGCRPGIERPGREPVQARRRSAGEAARRAGRGPAACGWAGDQRWTLARVADLIRRLFRVGYTLRGVSYMLHRLGFTPQVAAHRAAERDEGKITAWRAQTWVKARG
jgi:hypothetical protein